MLTAFLRRFSQQLKGGVGQLLADHDFVNRSYLSNNVVEDPDNDPPEPQNTEARAGEDVRDNLAAAVSAPDNCVRAFHEDNLTG
ncbi:hypothetical protein DPX16_3504 [Anabarilius grahami]|uniref:Uncharacterized protein n=1 Tax=Anabarilius grahami TaxID=495550 RepID=A0A3N0Y6P2_ANAGA|nr:hypothetical protein DPX16_3504 [Anabarilius grahami]